MNNEECKTEQITIIEKYKQILEQLKKSLNTCGWDGRWYKRAFTDDGDELGSLQNEECRIDGISQSWATISNAGDNDKKYISMESLENHLVDKENGIIKLLDPPFEKSKHRARLYKSIFTRNQRKWRAIHTWSNMEHSSPKHVRLWK